MPVLSYTYESLQLLLEELGLALSKPISRLLAWLMIAPDESGQALLEKTRAHLFRLAEKLPDDETTDMARRQRIRRFLSNSRIDVATFTPALLRLLRPLLLGVDEVMLSMDRTEWHRRGQVVNVLSVAIVLDGITCPLYWIVLSRPGATGLQHWQQVLTPAIDALRCARWLEGCPLTVAADREFASPKLAEWLFDTYRVNSVLRLKRSEYLLHGHDCQKVADWLAPLRCGQCRFLRDCRITQSSDFCVNVALLWEKGYDEPWVILSTHRTFPVTIEAYRKRWGIEPMHRHWKSSAFDIEGTRVTDPQRIARLLIPIALCYALCGLEGMREQAAGEVRNAHKDKRTTSLFLRGLTRFTRLLRAFSVSRVRQFFEQLFKGYRWLDTLDEQLHQRC